MNEEPLITTFTQLRKGFLRLASRFLPNEEDASDALQDAFCRLWPRRNQIYSSKEAEALAVTTIRNLCIDQVRKEKIPICRTDCPSGNGILRMPGMRIATSLRSSQ